VRSTNFLFTTLCTSIQNFGENRGQTIAVGMKFFRNATSRRPERRARPRRAVHAVPPVRSPRTPFRGHRAPRDRAPWGRTQPEHLGSPRCRVSRLHARAPGPVRVPPDRCPWLAFPLGPSLLQGPVVFTYKEATGSSLARERTAAPPPCSAAGHHGRLRGSSWVRATAGSVTAPLPL
jgi:hypothetical protein